MTWLLPVVMFASLAVVLVALPREACCYNYTNTPPLKRWTFLHHAREWHHGYYGVALVALSLIVPGWGSHVMLWAGVLLWADDLGQHVAQLVCRNGGFRSPAHRVYAAGLKRWQ